jgi:putative nucleotidyltransferase with HDIG domain
VEYLAKMQYEPDLWLKEVARVIELDPALTANVLRVANSAWSGSSQPIATVRDAVVRLGLSQILNLALIMSLSTPLKKACPGYDLAESELARHSSAAFLAAGQLCQFSGRTVPQAVTTIALLHDLGKILLGRYIKKEIQIQIKEAVKSGQTSQIEAEQQYLGTNHAEIGMAITRHWKLPNEWSDIIRRHHDYNPPFDTMLDAVQLSDTLAKIVLAPAEDRGAGLRQIPAEVLQRLELPQSDLALICVIVEEEKKKTDQMLGL